MGCHVLFQGIFLTQDRTHVSTPHVLQVAQTAKNLPGLQGSIPGLGRSPGGGNGKPLQYYHLKNPTDRGAWWATSHGVGKRWVRLSMHGRHGSVLRVSPVGKKRRKINFWGNAVDDVGSWEAKTKRKKQKAEESTLR